MNKKIRTTLAVLLISLLGFSACSSNPAGQNFADFIEDFSKSGVAATSSQKTDSMEIVEYDLPQFGEELGFDVTGYPNKTGMALSAIYVIDNWFAQLEYDTGEGRRLVLRIARSNRSDITTLYADTYDQNPSDYFIDETRARLAYNEWGDAMVTWHNDDFQFLFRCDRSFSPPTEAEINTLVGGVVCSIVPQAG